MYCLWIVNIGLWIYTVHNINTYKDFRILNIHKEMATQTTIHIPVNDKQKEIIAAAAIAEKLNLSSFVRRTALLESDKILQNRQVGASFQ
jgi:hypothetical protein